MHVLQVHLWSHPALMTLPQPPSIPATATATATRPIANKWLTVFFDLAMRSPFVGHPSSPAGRGLDLSSSTKSAILPHLHACDCTARHAHADLATFILVGCSPAGVQILHMQVDPGLDIKQP